MRFERVELDDEEHSLWVLEATVTTDSMLTMHLHYGGSLFVPGLDKLLAAEVDRAGDRLTARLTARLA